MGSKMQMMGIVIGRFLDFSHELVVDRLSLQMIGSDIRRFLELPHERVVEGLSLQQRACCSDRWARIALGDSYWEDPRPWSW